MFSAEKLYYYPPRQLVQPRVLNDVHCIIQGELQESFPAEPTEEIQTNPSSLATSFGFTVEKVDHAEYFGFGVNGNGRVLLSDFTVSHNSIYNFTG